MQLAISHQVLWNFSVGTFIKFATENFDGMELVDEPKPHGWELREETKSVRDALSTTNSRLTLHATYRDLNLGSINRAVRELSVSEAMRSIELANLFGAEVVTVHPGKIAGRKIPRADSVIALIHSLKELAKHAEENGVLLSLENMAGSKKLCKTAPEMLEVFSAVGADNIGATIDFSHVYLMGISPRRTVDALRKKLFNIHLSDSRGGSDHLSLGGGIMNLAEIFDLLHEAGYKRSVVLETWYSKDPLKGAISSAQAMVPLIKKRLSQGLPSPEGEESGVPKHPGPGAGAVTPNFPVPAN